MLGGSALLGFLLVLPWRRVLLVSLVVRVVVLLWCFVLLG